MKCSRRPAAFSLLEMLTTVAALVIVLGLMVSLAGYVRSRSAEALTRKLLSRLERAMEDPKYAADPALQAALARVPKLVSAKDIIPSEEALATAALANSKGFVRAWHQHVAADVLSDLPASLYDQTMLRDAWGTPVVFMPAGAINIAISPQNRYFFFSAGADRQFKTVDDNLYSYERTWER
jgi:type II secretory pathway pseudopilin PulG